MSSGYIEDRVDNLEGDVGDLKSTVETLEKVNEQGIWVYECKACQGDIQPNGQNLVFPLCTDCLKNLGNLTNFKRDLKFVE